MPPKSEKQRKFMCMDLARVRRGNQSKTGMSAPQLRDFCKKPVKGKKGKKK